jgi:hypothetical protein
MTEMHGTMLNWNHLASNTTTGRDRSLGLHKVEVPKTSGQSAHEGGKVVSPTHRQPFPPRGYPWYSFMLEAQSTSGPEESSEWKIPTIPSGIKPHLNLKWEMFQAKFVAKIKTHILCSVTFYSENSVVYEIMWTHTVKPGRPQTTV